MRLAENLQNNFISFPVSIVWVRASAKDILLLCMLWVCLCLCARVCMCVCVITCMLHKLLLIYLYSILFHLVSYTLTVSHKCMLNKNRKIKLICLVFVISEAIVDDAVGTDNGTYVRKKESVGLHRGCPQMTKEEEVGALIAPPQSMK